mgnify:CR=1 FL=1
MSGVGRDRAGSMATGVHGWSLNTRGKHAGEHRENTERTQRENTERVKRECEGNAERVQRECSWNAEGVQRGMQQGASQTQQGVYVLYICCTGMRVYAGAAMHVDTPDRGR